MKMGSLKIQFVFAILAVFILTECHAEFWNDLRVTWGIIPIGYFTRLPRTVRDAEREGWTTSQTSCVTDDENQFYGYAYMRDNDNTIALLYDVNGIISGIQAFFPHSDVLLPGNNVNYPALPIYRNVSLNNEVYFALTGYFVPPETICSVGRSESDLENEGTGTGLWFHNGNSGGDNIKVPINRGEAIEEGWTKNECFNGMGSHNFYQVEEYESHNCEEMRPTFGLYGKDGVMLGYGFILPGFVQNTRFENPPNGAIRAILGDAPQCVLDTNDQVGLTSIHVYFVDTPWFINCF